MRANATIPRLLSKRKIGVTRPNRPAAIRTRGDRRPAPGYVRRMIRVLHLDDPPIAVRLNENARARRLTLRLAASGEGAVLTLPPGVSEAEIRMFLMRRGAWLAAGIARRPRIVQVVDGVALPVDGTPLRIRHLDGPRRPPEIQGDALVVRGRAPPGPRIAAWLRERARARMTPAVRDYAARLGREVKGIAFKDTRSRWGSCSAAGRVNLSWRLALAPPGIQDYVAAHEAAHLVEMNHSRRYWAVLAQLMPDYADRRRWLRAEGQSLHLYRFKAQAASSAISSGGNPRR